mgnify:CR=1 FL=1
MLIKVSEGHNMKTIGIKLADGSFYPILEEGEAKTRQLDLTTVKDGQTKVQIDLYRSESGTMEDAEYVDTLEVSKLAFIFLWDSMKIMN